MAKDAIEETINALDQLEKSENQAFDGIDALEKALAAMEEFEELDKSEDEPGDEEEEDKGADDSGDSGDDGKEPVKKSEDDVISELEQELVKASECYIEMTNEIRGFSKSVGDELEDVKGALATLTGLTQSIGKAVVSLSKSLKELGNEPVGSRAHIGLGEEPKVGDEPIQKSKSEVVSIIKKAVQEGRCNASWMSKVAVHGPGCLPASVKRDLGI